MTVGNTTDEQPKDRDRRMSLFHLTVAEGDVGQPGDLETFASQAGVRARLWRPLADETPIEGIPATGVALARTGVDVTLTTAAGETMETHVTTTDYGEFFAQFAYDGDLTGATYTVTAQGHSWTLDADAVFRVNDEKLTIDADLETDNSPGPGLLVVLLGSSVAALALMRRRR